MNHSLRFFTLVCAALTGCVLATSSSAQQAAPQTPLAANQFYNYNPYGVADHGMAGNLFYNYYTQGPSNHANAGMYLAPRPVPAYVGHTYYTYQPLLPHEHMYSHVRNYSHSHPGNECTSGSTTKTKVVYFSGAKHLGHLPHCLKYFRRHKGGCAVGGGCPDGNCGASVGVETGGCSGGGCVPSASLNRFQR
jgi:hypothetical protein